MTPNLRLQWPSAAVSLPTLADRLLALANEIHFVELGLDAGGASRFAGAKDTVSSIRRALEDAMEIDEAGARNEIAARLSALLHALEDEGLSLTASVDQRIIENGAGVGRIDVLSIVVEPSGLREPRPAAGRPVSITVA